MFLHQWNMFVCGCVKNEFRRVHFKHCAQTFQIANIGDHRAQCAAIDRRALLPDAESSLQISNTLFSP
jgi:hypothetical protein